MTKSKKKKNPIPFIIIGMAVLLTVLGLLLAPRLYRLFREARPPLKFAEELKAAADRYGLDRRLVAAVVNTESGFNERAVSADGAEGLMQILPSTAEWIAGMRGIDYEDGMLFEPEVNLDYGCWLLNYLMERYGGDTRCALIAYNAGSGRLDKWLEESGGVLSEIPYAETRNYVDRITKLIPRYGEIYESELMD